MKLTIKKPSGVGKRHLGQQHNLGRHIAAGHYTSELPPLVTARVWQDRRTA